MSITHHFKVHIRERYVACHPHSRDFKYQEMQERISYQKIIKHHSHNSHELSESRNDSSILSEWTKGKAIKKKKFRENGIRYIQGVLQLLTLFLYLHLQLHLINPKECIHKLLASNINLFIYILEAKCIMVIYQSRNDISEIQEEQSQARSLSAFPGCTKNSISLSHFVLYPPNCKISKGHISHGQNKQYHMRKAISNTLLSL